MLEESIRKELKRSKIKRAILGSLAGVGIIAVTAIAPGLLSSVSSVLRTKYRYQRNYYFNKSIRRLIGRGLVVMTDRDGKKYVSITDKGKKCLIGLEKRKFKLKKPKSWDGKWRIVIFDVPEYRKNIRNQIRRTLQQMGFAWVQDSVWVYPYSCEEYIQLIKADFKIGKDVLYIIADRVENDFRLRKRFGLD